MAVAKSACGQRDSDSVLLSKAITGLRGSVVSQYEYVISSYSASDTQISRGSVYRNVPAFQFSNTTRDEQFYINATGMSRAAHKERTVYYHDWESPEELERAKRQFSGADGAFEGMDSVLFAGYHIIAVNKKGRTTTFSLAFPKDHLIQSMTIEVDASQKLLTAIRYSFQRPLSYGGYTGLSNVRQVVDMHHFRFGTATESSGMLTGNRAVPAMLRQQYPQYQIKKM